MLTFRSRETKRIEQPKKKMVAPTWSKKTIWLQFSFSNLILDWLRYRWNSERRDLIVSVCLMTFGMSTQLRSITSSICQKRPDDTYLASIQMTRYCFHFQFQVLRYQQPETKVAALLLRRKDEPLVSGSSSQGSLIQFEGKKSTKLGWIIQD